MRYIVTGGTGFLGKYIVDYLQGTGNEVFVATRHPQNGNHFLADFEKGILDLGTSPRLTDSEDETIVVHAAGKAHSVPKTDAEKKAFFDVNSSGTQMLLKKLEMMPNLPKALVFISSVSVYGKETGENISEDAPLSAKDPYGLSKIEAEKQVLDWGKKNNVIVAILRLPLVAGANPPGNLGTMIKGIKSGRYFRLGNGTARKSMVWAGDVAAVLPVVAQKGGIYNLSDGIHPSFAQLEDKITEELHLKPVKKLPMFIAVLAGIGGGFFETLTGKKMPINSRTVSKIISPLGFSDEKAKKNLGWTPNPVLSKVNEMLK